MKTIRMSSVLASMVGAAALFLVIPVSMSASPGMEWDVFYTGEGERIPSSYGKTAMGSPPSQNFDTFSVGDGVKVDDFAQAYIGTSMGSEASDAWDTFHVGDGDPLP